MTQDWKTPAVLLYAAIRRVGSNGAAIQQLPVQPSLEVCGVPSDVFTWKFSRPHQPMLLMRCAPLVLHGLGAIAVECGGGVTFAIPPLLLLSPLSLVPCSASDVVCAHQRYEGATCASRTRRHRRHGRRVCVGVSPGCQWGCCV